MGPYYSQDWRKLLELGKTVGSQNEKNVEAQKRHNREQNEMKDLVDTYVEKRRKTSEQFRYKMKHLEDEFEKRTKAHEEAQAERKRLCARYIEKNKKAHEKVREMEEKFLKQCEFME